MSPVLRSGLVLVLLLGAAQAGLLDADGLDRLMESRTPVNPRPLPRGQAPVRNQAMRPGYGPAAGSDSVIRTDFICNDDAGGGCSQRVPSIAVGPEGGFVISWHEFRDGDADAWFQQFDSAGNPLGLNQRLNTDVSLGWQGDPASAMAPGGGFLFSWEDRRQIGNSDLFAQRFDSSGQRIEDNFRVSDSGVPGDQSKSGAFAGPDRGFLIAWDDRRFGITGDIFAQFFNPDGSPLDTNFRVNDDPVGRANQYQPAVSGDDSGRYIVAWMDGRGLNWKDWNVFLQRFDSDGARLGTNIQVTTNDSVQCSPGLGVAPGGRFTVCWEDQRTGEQSDVYARMYAADGQPLGSEFQVNDDPGTGSQYSSVAAMNGFGESVVVWTDKRNGNEDVYAQLYDASGNAVGSNFRVNDDRGVEDQCAPTVASAPDGGYWVAWEDSRDDNDDIYCRRFDRSGHAAGSSFRVNDDGASSLQRVSSIAMNDNGISCVAWEDERNGPCDIYCCLFDSAGRVLGTNRRLNDDGAGGAAQYYAAAAAGSDRFLVAWTDGRDYYNIYAQFLDAGGRPVGANFRVNSAGGDAIQWYPYCAMNASNQAAVVWMDTRAQDAYRVFCRMYDSLGNPVGPEFPVSDSTGDQVYASVAMNDNGRVVVAWMDYREGEANIYCQRYREDGTGIGPNVRVNTDQEGAYQGYPSCAVDDDGGFVVAWEDVRKPGYDVYVQWFDSLGNPLGSNEQVNDGPADNDCYSPTCALDRAGRLALMFNDERDYPGNPQIYCQRFRPDRSRISDNQIINEPNLFANNHHWTVGQSVAANNEIVVFAWTDNRRHLGWDIYAKVTDWNLIGMAEPVSPRPGYVDWIRPTVCTDGMLRLAPGMTGSALRVIVRDPVGRIVADRSVPAGETVIDLGGLNPGVYFVTAEAGPGTVQAKLIVR